MAIQTLKIYHATPPVIVASGLAIPAGNRSAESGVVSSTQHGDYPLGNYELSITMLSAPVVGETVDLFARLYSLDGVTQSPAPSGTLGGATSYDSLHIGSFKLSSDLSQTLLILERRVPKRCTFYLGNSTSVQLEAGWELSVDLIGYGN